MLGKEHLFVTGLEDFMAVRADVGDALMVVSGDRDALRYGKYHLDHEEPPPAFDDPQCDRRPLEERIGDAQKYDDRSDLSERLLARDRVGYVAY